MDRSLSSPRHAAWFVAFAHAKIERTFSRFISILLLGVFMERISTGTAETDTNTRGVIVDPSF